MKCENSFCIFNNVNKCSKNEIEVDRNGVCRNCISINIEEGDLAELKRKTYENYEYIAREIKKKRYNITEID